MEKKSSNEIVALNEVVNATLYYKLLFSSTLPQILH